MAAADRSTVHPLIRTLTEEPTAFSFFRAVWLLERLEGPEAALGELGPARREAVRLRPSSSLAFPRGSIESVELRELEGGGPRWRVTTPVLGLYGSTSPLPSYYSEEILQLEDGEEQDDGRLFLDVLNHRLLSLLYRAWAKYRWEFTYRPDGRDRISSYLLGWIGLATEGLAERAGIPRTRLLRYAAALSQRPRCASSLTGVLRDYFEVPVALEQNVWRQVPIDPRDQSRLGAHNCRLGSSLMLGTSVPDRRTACRVVLGPIDFDRYEGLRIGGREYAELSALIRLLLPDSLHFEIEIRVLRRGLPAARLSRGADAPRLGWSSWLREERDQDPDEASGHECIRFQGGTPGSPDVGDQRSTHR